MTRKEFVTKATESLSKHYSPGEAKAISVRILSHFLGLSEYEYSVEPDTAIPRPELVRIGKALEELQADRPVQYVIGEEKFAGHTFNVSEAVIIPRPETDFLCRNIIKEWKSQGSGTLRILDAGTGSGCIAYTLAAAFPRAEVMAFDIDEAALETARSQKIYLDEACRQPLHNIPVFFKADMLQGPPDCGSGSSDLPNLEDLDILVSNPPYVCESEKDFMAPNVLDYEPALALFVPDSDPLRFYRALAEWAGACLRTGGRCYAEINEAYGQQTGQLFESRGFSEVEITEDFHGRPRYVSFTKWF